MNRCPAASSSRRVRSTNSTRLSVGGPAGSRESTRTRTRPGGTVSLPESWREPSGPTTPRTSLVVTLMVLLLPPRHILPKTRRAWAGPTKCGPVRLAGASAPSPDQRPPQQAADLVRQARHRHVGDRLRVKVAHVLRLRPQADADQLQPPAVPAQLADAAVQVLLRRAPPL